MPNVAKLSLGPAPRQGNLRWHHATGGGTATARRVHSACGSTATPHERPSLGWRVSIRIGSSHPTGHFQRPRHWFASGQSSALCPGPPQLTARCFVNRTLFRQHLTMSQATAPGGAAADAAHPKCKVPPVISTLSEEDRALLKGKRIAVFGSFQVSPALAREPCGAAHSGSGPVSRSALNRRMHCCSRCPPPKKTNSVQGWGGPQQLVHCCSPCFPPALQYVMDFLQEPLATAFDHVTHFEVRLLSRNRTAACTVLNIMKRWL